MLQFGLCNKMVMMVGNPDETADPDDYSQEQINSSA
jgi:hypothetical protein